MLLLLKYVLFFSTVNEPYESITSITKNYFANESVLFLYWNNVQAEISHELIRFLVKSEMVTLEIRNLDVKLTEMKRNKYYIKNTVILMNNNISVESNINLIKSCASWNIKSKILVILNNNTEDVNLILRQFWTLTKAINVTIMLAGKPAKFYTLFPYKPFQTEEVQIEQLYPNKIPKDFNQSGICAVTTLVEPYVLPPNEKGEYYDGLEIIMINEIAKRLNFRLVYKNLPKGELPWSNVPPQGKVTGTHGLLHRLEADILYHFTRMRFDKNRVSDVTGIYVFDELFWIVPYRDYSFRWSSLFLVFRRELWCLIGLYSFIVSLVIFVLMKSGRNTFTFKDASFQVLSTMFESPITYYHNGYLYRTFMMVFSFYALTIIATYKSSLMTFLTTPHSAEQYESLEEVVDAGLIGALYPGANITKNRPDRQTPLYKKMIRPGGYFMMSDIKEKIRWVGEYKKSYMMSTKLNIIYHLNQFFKAEHKKLKVYPLKNTAELYPVGMFTSKDHPIMPTLRKQVQHMIESGLTEYWLNKLLGKKDDSEEHEHEHGHGAPIPLSVIHIKGALYLYFIMFILSVITFICEIIYDKLIKLKQRRKIKLF